MKVELFKLGKVRHRDRFSLNPVLHAAFFNGGAHFLQLRLDAYDNARRVGQLFVEIFEVLDHFKFANELKQGPIAKRGREDCASSAEISGASFYFRRFQRGQRFIDNGARGSDPRQNGLGSPVQLGCEIGFSSGGQQRPQVIKIGHRFARKLFRWVERFVFQQDFSLLHEVG